MTSRVAGDERRRHRATRVAFLIAGIAMSAWAPLVPLAQARSGLDTGSFGLALLCFGGGSIVAMPAAGLAASRVGARPVVLAAVVVACGALPCLATVARPPTLAATLALFGAGLGALDVSMNLQAIAVERDAGHAAMSGFHAMFSAGGIFGAGGVALALSAGVDPRVTVAAIAVALVAAAFATRGELLATRTGAPARFARPHGIVLVLGFVAAAAFLVEGAVLDWSAILLATVRRVPVAGAGAGYVAFSLAMTAGRFGGDRLVQRVGGRDALVAGAAASASGLAIVAFAPWTGAALAGFALVGLGSANVVPVLFTAAGRQTVMPESLAVPAMTTIGYAGLLAGPAAIGAVARASSLPIAFALLALLMAAVAATGRRALR